MENKQTAVDFAVEKLEKFIPSGNQIAIDVIIEQAKAMHKQELLNIFNCGRNFQATGEGTFNEIYNEIYGKDNADNTAVWGG